MILQRQRPGVPTERSMETEAALLRAAEECGVPVAAVVASGSGDTPLGSGFLVSEFVEGESIARRILRDAAYADARKVLAAQCGRALAAVHSITGDVVDQLEQTDQLHQYREVLDAFGDPVPAFELAFRWLEAHRPPPQRRDRGAR